MPLRVCKTESPVCCKNSTDSVLRSLENSVSKTRFVRRGEPASLTLDPVESVYYVKAGCVKLVRYSSSGDEVVIDQCRAGSLFGNLHFCNWSLCCNGIEREIAIALEDSQILVTTFDSLKQNIGRYPEAAVALLEDYCQRLAVARLRIESLVLHEAEERLARALVIMATYQQPDKNEPILLSAAVTHEELARLIGVTRPFVTKLVGQLRDRGFVESVAAGQLLVYHDKITEAYS